MALVIRVSKPKTNCCNCYSTNSTQNICGNIEYFEPISFIIVCHCLKCLQIQLNNLRRHHPHSILLPKNSDHTLNSKTRHRRTRQTDLPVIVGKSRPSAFLSTEFSIEKPCQKALIISPLFNYSDSISDNLNQ
ncbi:unknown protein [Microcystis aeruginosa NIES-843]|uniref:Uncharacterized protein n=1 Tax=Microcystis aeruginosa (strain NIES-843 / IAM M-2473) TaxID=449447 RepID=B0JGH2_MICAN|nr:unknown protein [Microcystis aeruginosa NIES-843]